MTPRALASVIAGALCVAGCATSAGNEATSSSADDEDWVELFNGDDLDDWTVKIRGRPAGENHANTFRVEDGLLTVSYDQYSDFNNQFGHIFYNEPFSHYRLLVEYRFVDEPAPNTPDWAIRNSGAMIHAQAPHTMPPAQDFPISVEVQFLGGLHEGEPRPTANMCSPGTEVTLEGALAQTHCVNSAAPTFYGDQWVTVEALVLGGERVAHYVNGEPALAYGGLAYGGGVVSGHDPEMKPDGAPLTSGHIALQSEGHPIQFRRVALLNLRGCTDPAARNYKSYYAASDPQSCVY